MKQFIEIGGFERLETVSDLKTRQVRDDFVARYSNAIVDPDGISLKTELSNSDQNGNSETECSMYQLKESLNDRRQKSGKS